MTYTVIARKWRPLLFDDVIGQDHITVTLKNAIKKNRIAHAYLFAGPRGVGKTTTARILAKGANCVEGPTETPCNKCDNCIEINQSRSLDVIEIDGASNRGIDEIRNLRENVKYSPSKSRNKIYIIDEVHMLTKEAFNALLKTLEEPPPNVIFIFATTEPHKVLATIISRCQRFDFKRISLNDIIARLEYICEKENIKYDKESLFLISKKSDGSMRDALSLLDKIISFAGESFTIKDVENVLGVVNKDLFYTLTDAIMNNDIQNGINLVDRIIKEGYDFIEFLSGLLEHFRNIYILKFTNSKELIKVSEIEYEKLQGLSKSFPEEDLFKSIHLTAEYIYRIRRSTQPDIDFEFLVIKLIKMPTSKSVTEIIKNISAGETQDGKKNNSSQKKIELPEVPAVEQSGIDLPKPDEDITFDKIKSRWNEVIRLVKIDRMGTGSFLEEGELKDFTNNKLEILFSNNNGFHIDNVNKNKELIKSKIKKVYGVKFDFICKKGLVQKKVRKDEEEKSNILKEIIKKEPIIGDIIQTFNGEVKNIRRSFDEE